MATSSDSGATAQATGIRVQTKLLPVGGASPEAVSSSITEISAAKVQAIGELVDRVHSELSGRLAKLQPRPSGVSLEFGIDVSGEAGIPFVTKGSIGANFKVTVEWK